VKRAGRAAAAGAAVKKKFSGLPKILIADDSEESLRLYSTILKNKGYRITTAVNGMEALKKARKDPPELIFSDILMPVMDGFRLLQECKADPALSNIRFVFITGAFTDNKDEELGLKLGADVFLRKPIEPDELLHALEEVLSIKPTAGKRRHKPKEDKRRPENDLYNAAIMQKLEQKMQALEDEIADHQKSEESLAKSEEQYRYLFETMDQGVMCWAEGSVISANPAAARILGMDDKDLLGRTAADPIWKAFYEDGSDFAADDFPVTVAFKTGRPVRDVTMGFFNGRDDKFHWIRVSGIPQFHPGEDRPYQVYATLDDITDRFFAFKALQESESRMSAILENTQDAMWSVDRDFRLIAANNSARKFYKQIYGVTLTEGMDVRSAMPWENSDPWTAVGQRILNGERVTFEKRYDFAESPAYYEFSISPIVSASGRVTGAASSAKDITERKKAEQQMKESEEIFRKAVQSTTDIVWDWDIGSGHVEWYGDIDGMLGYNRDEFPRTLAAWENALHPDDHDRVMAALDRHAETGEPYNVEYRIVRRDGSLRNWIDRGLVIYDENGKITHSIGACVDITEHRQSEQRGRIRRDLALKLAGCADMQTALRYCLDAAIEISGFDTGAIFIRDEKSGDFKAACHHGGSAYLEEHYSVLKADSVDARIRRKGQSIYVTAEEFTTPFDEQLRPEGLTFDAMIPVVYQGRVIASLDLFSHTQNNLPLVIRDSLEAIAADIGIIIDRISSRQALQDSEEKYRLVVENAGEAIFVAQDGMLKFANQNTASMIGYQGKDLSSKPFIDFIHPDDREFVVERHLRRLKGEIFEETYPFRVVKRDGQMRWVEIQAVLIQWEERPATLNFITDITERRRAEKALIESEIKYRSLVDTSSSGVAVADETGNLTLVNDRLCQIYGYDKDEVMGRQFFDFIHPDDRERITADFLEAVTKNQTLPAIEFRGVRKDGSIVWLFTNPSTLIIEGRLTGFSVIIQDITQLKQAEAALKESAQRYRSLFQHNPNAVYSLDLQGRFTSINAAATALSGYSEAEAEKMSLQQIIASEYLETVRRNFARACGGEPQAYELAIITKNGKKIDCFVTSTPIIIDGKVIGVYGIAEDITGRKKAAQDLKAALEKASSTLDGTIEAIAMMSELRDPYTAGHQRMVSQLAVAIATEIGMEQNRVEDLAVAGLLHDVGKVYVPSEILSKPGKLTDLELGLAKAHAEASYNIVRSIKFSGPIAHIVWQHHERMDGSGYPQGLVGDQIMLEARILAVADVVEAMVSHRPYRPALGLEKALDEITSKRAVLYDAQAVDACLVQFNEKGFQFHD